jgi:hypothetical protein
MGNLIKCSDPEIYNPKVVNDFTEFENRVIEHIMNPPYIYDAETDTFHALFEPGKCYVRGGIEVEMRDFVLYACEINQQLYAEEKGWA